MVVSSDPEKPGQKVDRKNCHAKAEDDTGKGPLAPTLAERERQSTNHDSN